VGRVISYHTNHARRRYDWLVLDMSLLRKPAGRVAYYVWNEAAQELVLWR
jgi:hypothetical protein